MIQYRTLFFVLTDSRIFQGFEYPQIHFRPAQHHTSLGTFIRLVKACCCRGPALKITMNTKNEKAKTK